VPTVVLLLYHWGVCPVEHAADKLTVPLKHTAPGTTWLLAGADKFGFTVPTTEILFDGMVSQLVVLFLQPT
jgi:hypothetical protein